MRYPGCAAGVMRRVRRNAASKLKDGRCTSQISAMSSRRPPGTVLIREWHGVGHQVTIGADGVLYRGERYGSLSEVARLITGARWSGPRFFGVKA